MKAGTGTIDFTIHPEGEDSADMLVKFTKSHDEFFTRVYVLTPGSRQMKGMFKILPDQVQNLADVLSLMASSEVDE